MKRIFLSLFLLGFVLFFLGCSSTLLWTDKKGTLQVYLQPLPAGWEPWQTGEKGYSQALNQLWVARYGIFGISTKDPQPLLLPEQIKFLSQKWSQYHQEDQYHQERGEAKAFQVKLRHPQQENTTFLVGKKGNHLQFLFSKIMQEDPIPRTEAKNRATLAPRLSQKATKTPHGFLLTLPTTENLSIPPSHKELWEKIKLAQKEALLSASEVRILRNGLVQNPVFKASEFENYLANKKIILQALKAGLLNKKEAESKKEMLLKKLLQKEEK